jgi:hypothetical protein
VVVAMVVPSLGLQVLKKTRHVVASSNASRKGT